MPVRFMIPGAKYLMLIVFSLCASNLRSLPLPPDSAKFNCYFKKAESLKKEVKFKEAIENYKSALAYSDNLKDVLIANRNISALFYGLN
ncbi:MAG: hypothetical protein ACKO1F_06370, partial [Flammeovirgaceae bacterium]